ncbi:putative galacturonosyltransferase 14 [Hordeum vulgare]|nr:putative galacturonosyltransferase 14 [Hordeum vulgare]
MIPFNDVASTANEVFNKMVGSNDATAEFVNFLDTNNVDIDQAPICDFNYNEMDGGVDSHGGEDEVEDIDEVVYDQAQAKKGARSKNYTLFKDQMLIKAWSSVFLDACTGTSQTAKREVHLRLDDDQDDDGPRNLNKPVGDKKSREKIKREHEASSLRDKIDAMVQSNELILAKTFEEKKELAEKKAREKQEKWQLLKDAGLRKADVEERRVLDDETKAMAKLLVEENKIMTLNRDDMNNITKNGMIWQGETS